VRRYFQIAAILDLILVFLLFGDPKTLLNSQIAFISSLFVVLGSYWGYAGLVRRGELGFGYRDAIERIEDPHGFDDEVAAQDAKALFEEEKRRVKKSGNLKAFLSTYRGFFSPFRLIGYLFLVVAVLVLVRKGLFDPVGFLVGLAVVPAAALVTALLPERS
jgi:hypothetical protein